MCNHLFQIHHYEFIPMFEKQFPDHKWADVEVRQHCGVLVVVSAPSYERFVVPLSCTMKYRVCFFFRFQAKIFKVLKEMFEAATRQPPPNGFGHFSQVLLPNVLSIQLA